MSAGPPLPIRAMGVDLPARIGNYPVRSIIGTGSMGVVYLGHDPVIDRLVAIKTIQRQLLDTDAREQNAAARFRIEAQAAGRLNHRNIVSVYQFGEDAECAYIVMEYVPGRTLGEYLQRAHRFTHAEVHSLMFQLLDALHYAHESGVVHRDIKPANLMIDRDGRLKIADFGIARTESSQVTRVNAVVGSPGYMAPEQYTGGALDRRVDVFSAGVLLYQLLSGGMPFSGTDEAIMYQIVYGECESLVRRSKDAALAVFEPIVDGALHKDPKQRYATALAFSQALRAVMSEPIAELLPRERLLPALAHGPSAADAAVPDAAGSGSRGDRPSGAGIDAGGGTDPACVPVPTGWDETELSDLERDLARHVGPVAKVLVRRAARGQSDLAAVRRRVAESIHDLDVRRRFLESSGVTRVRTVPGSSPGSGFADTRPATAPNGVRLQPEDVDKARAVLAQSLGPIAAVLARQSAARSSTREQFVARLLEQLTSGVDRQKVEAELWRVLR